MNNSIFITMWTRVSGLASQAPLTLSVSVQALALALWQSAGGNLDGLVLTETQANWTTIFTGPLIHGSWPHLILNLLLFAVVGSWFERRFGWRYTLGYTGIAVVVAAAFVKYDPSSAYQAGLGGHAAGLAAMGIFARQRRLGWLVLAGLGLACLLQWMNPLPGSAGWQVVELSGVFAGALCGLLFADRVRRRPRALREPVSV